MWSFFLNDRSPIHPLRTQWRCLGGAAGTFLDWLLVLAAIWQHKTVLSSSTALQHEASLSDACHCLATSTFAARPCKVTLLPLIELS